MLHQRKDRETWSKCLGMCHLCFWVINSFIQMNIIILCWNVGRILTLLIRKQAGLRVMYFMQYWICFLVWTYTASSHVLDETTPSSNLFFLITLLLSLGLMLWFIMLIGPLLSHSIGFVLSFYSFSFISMWNLTKDFTESCKVSVVYNPIQEKVQYSLWYKIHL